MSAPLWLNESRHTFEWATSHVWMSRGMCMSESLPHTWMRPPSVFLRSRGIQMIITESIRWFRWNPNCTWKFEQRAEILEYLPVFCFFCKVTRYPDDKQRVCKTILMKSQLYIKFVGRLKRRISARCIEYRIHSKIEKRNRSYIGRMWRDMSSELKFENTYPFFFLVRSRGIRMIINASIRRFRWNFRRGGVGIWITLRARRMDGWRFSKVISLLHLLCKMTAMLTFEKIYLESRNMDGWAFSHVIPLFHLLWWIKSYFATRFIV